MIDQELLKEIRSVASSHEILEMHGDDASSAIRQLRDTFIGHSAGQWWWESLRGEAVAIQYGSRDGLSIVGDLVERDESVFFVPTDDASPPWPVFFGDIDRFIALLKELRFFEYFLTDKDSTWAVFDTHDNCLVVIGTLIDKASEIQVRIDEYP